MDEQKELCIRCGRPTPYDIHTPITTRLYYIEGSGQLCEQCFSQLYPRAGSTQPSASTSPAPSLTPTQREQGEPAEVKQIKTINIEGSDAHASRPGTLIEYDEAKNAINIWKHKMSIHELATIFNNPFNAPTMDIPNELHLQRENRYHAYG